jgi:Flp pilus assembly protein TadG
MKAGYLGRVIKKNCGSTLVEFAFVFPLLAFILFAIMQYGFLFAAYITVRNASAVGARQAIISTNNVKDVAKAALSPMLDSSKAPDPVLTVTNVAGAPAFAVTVTYPMSKYLMLPFTLPPFNKSNTNRMLSATTIMR